MAKSIRQQIDEIELFAKLPNLAIRNFLIENNMPLAIGMAARYACEYYDMDDAKQDACVALCRAVDEFDIKKGFQFSTFACSVIWRELHTRKKRAQRKMLWSNQEDDTLEKSYDDPEYQEPVSLKSLEPRERHVIKARFWQNKKLRELGEELGITKERVRQIEKRAISKLRERHLCKRQPTDDRVRRRDG